MVGSNEDRGRSRRPSAEDQKWSHRSILGGWMIGRSGDAVCGLHHAQGDEERGFLGSASKPRSTVCQWFGLETTRTVYQWFGLKTTGTVSPGLASKPVVTVFSGLTSKLVATVSPDLASKPVMGFLVEPQHQVVEGFPVWVSKLIATVW
jgi:hypothetical protein